MCIYLHTSGWQFAVGLASVGFSGIHKSTKSPSVGSMLAHVLDLLALCWLRLAHFGLMLGHVGLKTAQDCSMLAPGGFKTPKMASRGLQDALKMLREGLKMI